MALSKDQYACKGPERLSRKSFPHILNECAVIVHEKCTIVVVAHLVYRITDVCVTSFESNSLRLFNVSLRQLVLSDSETLRTPTLMCKRTIRIRDKGGWSGVGGAYVCGTATVYDTVHYLTRCYFNVRSKADMVQPNLPHGNDN